MKTILKAFLSVFLFVFIDVSVHASTRSGLLTTISRIAGREVSEEYAQGIVSRYAKELGPELLERIQGRLLREGGEAMLTESAELAVKYGPDVLRALDNSTNPNLVLKWINEVPSDEVLAIVRRLSAGSVGRELGELGSKSGISVIRAEAKHPGVAIAYARKLPKEWVETTLDLSTDQAMILGKHIDDLALLPPSQQKQLLELCRTKPTKFLSYVEDFVQKNPGKVLFTASATTILIANSRQLFGDERLEKERYHGGFFGYLATLGRDVLMVPFQWTLYGIGTVLIVSLSIYLGLKLACVSLEYFRTRKDLSEQVCDCPNTGSQPSSRAIAKEITPAFIAGPSMNCSQGDGPLEPARADASYMSLPV